MFDFVSDVVYSFRKECSTKQCLLVLLENCKAELDKDDVFWAVQTNRELHIVKLDVYSVSQIEITRQIEICPLRFHIFLADIETLDYADHSKPYHSCINIHHLVAYQESLLKLFLLV